MDYSVSPSPSPFPLDFGFGILDLDFGLGFGTGLGLLTIKNYILGHHSYIFCSLTSGEIDF